MALNLLSIVFQETQPIDEEKLKFICSKCSVWDHFKVSKENCSRLSEDEQMQVLTRFYNELEPVYYGNGKNFFCCKDCVWSDDGRIQNCLRCKVNVIYCDCLSDDEHITLSSEEAK